jgi:hypothetical protein
MSVALLLVLWLVIYITHIIQTDTTMIQLHQRKTALAVVLILLILAELVLQCIYQNAGPVENLVAHAGVTQEAVKPSAISPPQHQRGPKTSHYRCPS